MLTTVTVHVPQDQFNAIGQRQSAVLEFHTGDALASVQKGDEVKLKPSDCASMSFKVMTVTNIEIGTDGKTKLSVATQGRAPGWC